VYTTTRSPAVSSAVEAVSTIVSRRLHDDDRERRTWAGGTRGDHHGHLHHSQGRPCRGASPPLGPGVLHGVRDRLAVLARAAWGHRSWRRSPTLRRRL